MMFMKTNLSMSDLVLDQSTDPRVKVSGQTRIRLNLPTTNVSTLCDELLILYYYHTVIYTSFYYSIYIMLQAVE